MDNIKDIAYVTDRKRPLAPSVRARILVERRIIRRLVNDLLVAGFQVEVWDGEETALQPSIDIDAIMGAIMTTDDDHLYVYKTEADGTRPKAHFGWIQLVYGNDGYDVVSDYTVNLEEVLKPSAELADAIAEGTASAEPVSIPIPIPTPMTGKELFSQYVAMGLCIEQAHEWEKLTPAIQGRWELLAKGVVGV